VIAGGVASIQAGAGIVADSVPEREWEETGNKARALLTALGRIRPVERQAR
jgi:anthranilate synthase component 1